MKVSPLDLRQVRFRTTFRGFDKAEVLALIAEVTDDYENALKEVDKLRQDVEKMEALLTIDLKATMRLSRNIGARMKERGRGVILTIGWDQAETGMEGDSGQLFGAVKGAVMCFTRSLALSLAPEVRVNCIAPGWIRTKWGETASAAWQERVRRETPLGVWGLPEDVAAAALWLASPASSYQTGQTIRVNGGTVR